MALTPFPISGPIVHTPDPSQPLDQFLFRRNPRTGALEIATSRDGGVTSQVLLASPPPRTPVGAAPLFTKTGDVAWGSPAAPATAPAAIVSASAATAPSAESVDLVQMGQLFLGQTFGYFVAPETLLCVGMTLSLQGAALGSAATVTLVSTPANVESNQSASLASGLEYAQVTFGAPTVMAAGSAWRLRIKAVGSTFAGEYLSVRLLLANLA